MLDMQCAGQTEERLYHVFFLFFFIFYVLVGTWTDIRAPSQVFIKGLPNLLNNFCLFIEI